MPSIGGPAGLRDEGALSSALARPVNLVTYGDPDLFDLAARGIVQNHPFVDGNTRTAFVVQAAAFLELNGQELNADEADAAIVFLKLAAGDLDEPELSDWLRRNSSPPNAEFLAPEQDQ